MQPDNLEEFALAFDGLAVALRRDLGIEEDCAWAFGELSGGQQKRLQVACALWAQPDVLAVDEPTNHLDATTRHAIATALSRFAGVGLLVSHDRELLDVLCSQCLFVTRVGAVMRPGGYAHASSQAALERRSAAHARAEDRLAGARVEKRYEGGIRAEARPSRRPVLLDTEPTTPRRGAFALSVPAPHIGSNDRIGLVGDNGTGKSTLVSHDLAIVRTSTAILWRTEPAGGGYRLITGQAISGLRGRRPPLPERLRHRRPDGRRNRRGSARR